MLIPFRPRRERDFNPIIKKPVFNPSGLDFSLPSINIPDHALSNCKNVFIQDGEIKSRFGYEYFGNNLPLSYPITGFAQVYKYDGTQYLLCFTTVKAYKYDTGTGGWSDITDSEADYTGAVTDPFSVEMIYDDNAAAMKFVSTNRTDAVKKWTGSGNWDDLGGSPNKCKFLRNFYHHLMLFDVDIGGTRFPQRIDWSDIGEPEDWSAGSSGNVNLARTSDFIMGAEFIRGQLAIFKERSICMCKYVGGTTPFEFDERRIKGTGLIAINAMASLGDKIPFLDSDLNVSIFDGFTVYPVNKKIRAKFVDSINPEKVELSHMHTIDELNLLLLFVPTPGSSYPDSVWIWDYETDNWFHWEFANKITSTGYYQLAAAIKIGDLVDKIGTFNWRIASRTGYTSFPFSLIGDKDGYIYKLSENLTNDNGTVISSEFETKSYFLGGVGQFVRGNNFGIYGKGDPISVYASEDDGVNYKFQSVSILNKNASDLALGGGLKKTSEKMMFKIKNDILDDSFAIRGWNPSVIKKGKKVRHSYLKALRFNNGELVQTMNVEGELETVYVRQ